MPKMKTHSGAKKRFKVTATGKVRGRHAFTSHILEKKSPKRKRALGRATASRLRCDDAPREGASGCWGSGRMRVKRSVHARKKRRATLELTKGFRGEANSNYSRAKEALMKADAYAYRDRRNRKRDFRRLWITRINAAARQNGMSYSQFMHGLAAGRGRAGPQGAGGHRRARRRHVPTFCRDSPRGVGCLDHRTADTEAHGRRSSEGRRPFSFQDTYTKHIMTIASHKNPQLQDLRRLHRRRGREQSGLFLAEGEDLHRGRARRRLAAAAWITACRDSNTRPARTSWRWSAQVLAEVARSAPAHA